MKPRLKEHRFQPIIAVIGAGQCSQRLKEEAAAVGRYVAEQGGVIVCGGRGGIMEGVCRGAAEAGGTTIGILPSGDANEANPYVTYAVPTGLGEARNAVIIRTCDAVLAFPGRFGTLSEIAFALKMGKPVVSVGSWDVDDQIVQLKDPLDAARRAMALALQNR